MKTYEETIRAVFTGRDKILKERESKSRRRKHILIPLACSLAVILAGVGIWKSGVMQASPTTPQTKPNIQTTLPALAADTTTEMQTEDVASALSGNADFSAVPSSQGYTVPVPDGAAPETAAVTVPAVLPQTTPEPEEGSFGGHSSGGIGEYSYIPALPQNREIITVGERITDEEAAAYFSERKGALISSLTASGVAADTIRIAEKGYCHVCYAGLEGERLEVRENFRDYLVYNGDSLIAIVTLYKENGKLYDTPAFGAAWFADYQAFLRQHQGEALIYVYAGMAEIILTPDGGMYSALAGIQPAAFLQGIDDPYRLFYHPDDVYIP